MWIGILVITASFLLQFGHLISLLLSKGFLSNLMPFLQTKQNILHDSVLLLTCKPMLSFIFKRVYYTQRNYCKNVTVVIHLIINRYNK